MMAVAVSLPFLMLQDLWRFALIMQARQRSAAANDGLWLLIMLLSFAIGTLSQDCPLLERSHAGPSERSSRPLGSDSFNSSCRPSRAEQWAWWWQSNATSAARFALEFLLVIGVSYALTIGVAVIGGLEDSAGLRGAMVLMGPLNILFMGVGIQVLPHHGAPSSRDHLDRTNPNCAN
jgi:hypothetical protein